MNPATTWALAWLRSNPRTGVLGARNSLQGRAVLLILAALADEALNSPHGYDGHRAADVARLNGMAASTAARWLRILVEAGMVVDAGAGVVRIPEEAFS